MARPDDGSSGLARIGRLAWSLDVPPARGPALVEEAIRRLSGEGARRRPRESRDLVLATAWTRTTVRFRPAGDRIECRATPLHLWTAAYPLLVAGIGVFLWVAFFPVAFLQSLGRFEALPELHARLSAEHAGETAGWVLGVCLVIALLLGATALAAQLSLRRRIGRILPAVLQGVVRALRAPER